MINENYLMKTGFYYPENKKVEFLVIDFEKKSLFILGRLLSLYGRNRYFFDSIFEDLIFLKKNESNLQALNNRFWVFDDGKKEDEDTGLDLGLIAIIANPEYDPHIYYQINCKKIFLLDESNINSQSMTITLEKFIHFFNWWKDCLDKFSDSNIS